MRVRQVMKQTRARIYRGDTRAEGKIVSLFEPMTEVIRNQRFFCSRFCSGLLVERFGMHTRNGQKWRTGCEGRISVTKRRHGLNRCRYRGVVGMKHWVGSGGCR